MKCQKDAVLKTTHNEGAINQCDFKHYDNVQTKENKQSKNKSKVDFLVKRWQQNLKSYVHILT